MSNVGNLRGRNGAFIQLVRRLVRILQIKIKEVRDLRLDTA